MKQIVYCLTETDRDIAKAMMPDFIIEDSNSCDVNKYSHYDISHIWVMCGGLKKETNHVYEKIRKQYREVGRVVKAVLYDVYDALEILQNPKHS